MSGTIIADVTTDCGPLIMGELFAFGLSGCLNMQFILYWQVHPDFEPWSTKSLVTAIWILDMCHSIFIAVAVWDTVITPFGNLDMIDTIPWSIGPTVELTAIITCLVQSFFVYRIYKLQRNKLTVAGPVFVLIFTRIVTASVTTAEMIKLAKYSIFGRPFPAWLFTFGLSLSALVDIIIMSFLCYFLKSNRSPLQSTNRIMDTLTIWTVQNGSATCFGAVATLICWLRMPQNRVFLGVYFVVAKLYANSLIATLNARIKNHSPWRNRSTPLQVPPLSLFPEDIFIEGNASGLASQMTPRQSSIHAADLFALQPLALKQAHSSKVEVNVSRTVETMYDREKDIDMTEGPQAV